MKKKRMNNAKFLCLCVPLLAVSLGTMIAVTCVMNYYSGVLDMVLGKGERHIENVEGSDQWDLNYYDRKYSSADEALKASTELSRKVGNEGFVLLKNDKAGKGALLPLAEKTKVSPLGYRYLNPVYSVLGSGAVYDSMFSYTSTNAYSQNMEGAIASNFTVNEEVVLAMKGATPEKIGEAEGTTPCQTLPYINACAGGNTFLTEYNPSIYNKAAESCRDTVGLVFIGRDAGEGGDNKMDAYADGTRHEQALSQNEKQTIKFAKENCTKGVVAVINSCSLMELGELMSGEYEVDAIVWIGYPGSIGCQSLSDLLCGKQNFSGRTVDLWASDFTKDPTYVNMFLNRYSNVSLNIEGKEVNAPFVEYEEGIYVGYRYYETAAEIDDTFNYDKAVCYPFGFGLSYTTFEQKISSYSDFGDTITVEVEVKNTGSVPGKDVVQVYYSAPYTQFDADNQIEKASVNLARFAKTGVLNPGKSEKVTISFEKEQMASYSYLHENGDGTKGCYILEGGDYTVSLRSDSHTVIEEKKTAIPATIYYTNDNPRQSEKDGQSLLDDAGNPTGIPAKKQIDPAAEFIAATNEFEDCNQYMQNGKVKKLTRADWKNSFPTAPTDQDRIAADNVKHTIEHYHTFNYDVETDPLFGNVEGSIVYRTDAPVSKADNGLTLADMRGKDYYDADWEVLLDQIDYTKTEELTTLLYGGAYNIHGLASIGMPASTSAEGPSGIGLFADLLFNFISGKKNLPDTCAYCSNMVIASTWNKELAYECGNSVGQEAMFYPEVGDAISGWTGPGVNLHRSPFNGRNGEYYSEDPMLAGTIATAQISGAADAGLIIIFKHFAVNNTENHRSDMCVWADEQTLRELYLNVFERIFKDSRRTVRYISDTRGTVSEKVIRGANSVMTSMNCVGAMAAGNEYEMIQNVLRGEWGFQGFVQSDMPTHSDKDLLLRTGGDMEMNMAAAAGKDMTSPTMQWCIRRAVHNIAFAVANSRVMDGTAPGAIIYYDVSPWVTVLTIVNVVVYVAIAVVSTLAVLRTIDSKKHPENYKEKV